MLIYFLPGIIALGIITSYEDIKFGKIRNKWIVLALTYALVVNVLLLIYFKMTIGININYIIELFTNFIFAILLGFGLWNFQIWSAGDGKLFIAFSALLPLNSYLVGYQNYVPSIALLVNVFFLGMLFLMGYLIKKTSLNDFKKVLKEFFKEFFEPLTLFESIASFFAIFWLLELLLMYIGLSQNYILKLILTMLVFSSIKKQLGEKTIYLMVFVSLVRFGVDKSIYSLSFLTKFLLFLLIWKLLMSLFRGSLSKLGNILFSKHVKVKELKKGMILSDNIIKARKKPIKKELEVLKKSPGFQMIHHNKYYYFIKAKKLSEKDVLIKHEAEGLSQKEVNTIKKLGFKTVGISQVMPFAQIMFFGVLITILIKGNLLIFAKILFGKLLG